MSSAPRRNLFASEQFIQSEAMHAGEPGLTASGSDTAERLLIEAAQTDPGRFAELYEKHFDRVYAFILRRVGDRTQAEDLTSDVFHQAFANLADSNGEVRLLLPGSSGSPAMR